MKPKYEAFLTELCEAKRKHYVESQQASLTRADLVRAECNNFTRKFVERFPNLRRVAGFYGRTEHWWCVEPDGTIVDPTAEQFGPGGVYRVLDSSKDQVRIGKCMNCGWEIFGLLKDAPKSICSQECETAYETYMNEGR